MSFFNAIFGSRANGNEEKGKDNKNFDTLKYDGVRALKQGQPAYAIKCFTHALEISEDLECRDYLSQAYVANDELAPAYEQLQLLSEAQPDNVAILLRMAEVAYMQEDYDAMATACEKALENDKEDPSILYSYARACNGQGNAISAIALLTKALTIKDDFAPAHLLRGELLLKLGDTKGAAEDAAYLKEHIEGNEDVLLLSARVDERSGDHDQAIADYGKVIEANPFNVAAFKERGAIRLAIGDKKGAEEDMHSVLELDPNAANTVNGDYSAEGVEHKAHGAYRSVDPFGIFG